MYRIILNRGSLDALPLDEPGRECSMLLYFAHFLIGFQYDMTLLFLYALLRWQLRSGHRVFTF